MKAGGKGREEELACWLDCDSSISPAVRLAMASVAVVASWLGRRPPAPAAAANVTVLAGALESAPGAKIGVAQSSKSCMSLMP